MFRLPLLVVLLLNVLLDALPSGKNFLTYEEHLHFKQLQHTTYNQYLRALEKRNQRYQLYKSMLALSTPQPVLKNLFFDNDTKVGDTKAQSGAAYVGLSQAFNRPTTIDDDIEIPLNQPYGDRQSKTNFYNWAQLYSNYYNNHPNYYDK